MRLTAEEIEAGRSPRGGWTRAQLAAWGVPWPPPKGWQQRLLKDEAPDHAAPPKPVLIGRTGGPVADDSEERPPWE